MQKRYNFILVFAVIVVLIGYLFIHFKVRVSSPLGMSQACMLMDERGQQAHEQALTNNVERGRTMCVQYLLKHGSNPDEGQGNLYTPLLASAQYGRVQEAQLLIKAGANVNFMGVNGPPLCRALRNQSGSLELVALLVNSGAHLTWPSGSALECLGDYNGRKEKFQYLLGHGILNQMTPQQIQSSLTALNPTEKAQVNNLINTKYK